MKRSTISLLLLSAIIAISLIDIFVEGQQFVWHALPLCGIAVLYGYSGIILGLFYILLLWMVMFSLGTTQLVPLWQGLVVLILPTLAIWVSALRERGINLERMQRCLLEGMRDGVILSDPDHVIHLINPAAYRLLALPRSVEERHARLREIGIISQWAACMAHAGEETTEEYKVNEQYIRVATVSVYEDKRLMGLVTTIADYTSERQLSTMREDFLAFVSHELRNPLTSINGFAEVLAMQPLPEKLTRYAQVIKRNTGRMLRLIHDLLQLCSFDVGTFHLRVEDTELTALLRALVDSMTFVTEEAQVSLETDIPDVAIIGSYDADRLSQVFANLLDNAIHFTPGGGIVRLAVTLEQDRVLVEVADAGPGIPADEVDKIFDKYYQAANRPIVGHGAGLGLAISRYLVQQHQGKIWATSREGRGTSFWVSLPCFARENVPYTYAIEPTLSIAAESSVVYRYQPDGDRLD